MKIIILILFYILNIVLSCIYKKKDNKYILNLAPKNIKNNNDAKNDEEFLKEIQKYLINENK